MALGYLTSLLKKEFLARDDGISASVSCLAGSVGPIVTGKLFAVGVNVGYVGIAFRALSAISFVDVVES
ncbi:hypothetical protein F5Y12DRAFT_728227 [Xylaria sp. FL1777]|nr:hypothetical protein F5Y12DRAFT_728227 [Xylaria sp. FL1777]